MNADMQRSGRTSSMNDHVNTMLEQDVFTISAIAERLNSAQQTISYHILKPHELSEEFGGSNCHMHKFVVYVY